MQLAFGSALAVLAVGCDGSADVDWPVYLGDNASSQYSWLDQINVDNVGQLKLAWTYRSGDADPEDRSQIQCNPVIVDGVLYGTSPQLKLFALDAATGEELWRFDPFDGDYRLFGLGVNRGVVLWEDRVVYGAGEKPYVAAGGGKMGTPSGDAYLAFALPRP